MLALTLIGSLLALVLLALVWRSHRSQVKALIQAPRSARLAAYPSVTVIRPIRGLDAGAEENIGAALDTGYPGQVETIFVFDDLSEPAIPLVRRACVASWAAGGPGGRLLLAGTPPAGRTGKLNAMIVGLRQARGEIIVFADSDIRPDRDALRVLVETLLSSPEAGASFAPVVATLPHQSMGDAGYALLLNGLYGPSASLAAAKTGGTLPFIMGQFMAFKREAIEAIGGLECADGQLVDDMYLGERVCAAGYQNRVSPRPVPVIQEGLSATDFLKTFVRWITFSRSGLPGKEFKLASWLRGVVFWVGLLASTVALAFSLWVAGLALALVPLAVAVSINRLHRAIGGAPLRLRHLPVAFGLLLAAPAVYLSIFSHREVTWRGRTYRLDAGSRLADEPHALAA